MPRTNRPTKTTDSESVHSAHDTHVTLSTLGATAPDGARDEFASLHTHMQTRDKVKMLLDKESPRCDTDELADSPRAASPAPRSVARFATAKSVGR